MQGVKAVKAAHQVGGVHVRTTDEPFQRDGHDHGHQGPSGSQGSGLRPAGKGSPGQRPRPGAEREEPEGGHPASKWLQQVRGPGISGGRVESLVQVVRDRAIDERDAQEHRRDAEHEREEPRAYGRGAHHRWVTGRESQLWVGCGLEV